MLIKPEELLEKLKEEIVIVDVRAFSNYVRGHIPKAYWFYVWDLTRHDEGLPSTLKEDRLAEILSKNGLDSEKETVIYCDMNSLTHASYLFFVLEYLGYEKAKILEGGFEAWSKKGYPIEKGIVKPKQASFKIANKKDIKVDFNYVEKNLGRILLIDTRSREEYEGKVKSTMKEGRIPTSVNLPHTNFVKEMPYVINLEEIRDKIKEMKHDREVVLYCSAGDRATYIYFLFKLIGLKPKVYLESFYDWSLKGGRIEV